MIVIHPHDASTDFLCPLYDRDDVSVRIDETWDEDSIISFLKEHPEEGIMMLGHGCGSGLFCSDKYGHCFGRLIVSSRTVPYLKGRDKVIAIWCNADEFGKRHQISGLWSGMIVSEYCEAYMVGVEVHDGEVERENDRLVESLVRNNLVEEPKEIPFRMWHELDNDNSPLREFNYNNFHYMMYV